MSNRDAIDRINKFMRILCFFLGHKWHLGAPGYRWCRWCETFEVIKGQEELAKKTDEELAKGWRP